LQRLCIQGMNRPKPAQESVKQPQNTEFSNL
jgi:hypothetical protein